MLMMITRFRWKKKKASQKIRLHSVWPNSCIPFISQVIPKNMRSNKWSPPLNELFLLSSWPSYLILFKSNRRYWTHLHKHHGVGVARGHYDTSSQAHSLSQFPVTHDDATAHYFDHYLPRKRGYLHKNNNIAFSFTVHVITSLLQQTHNARAHNTCCTISDNPFFFSHAHTFPSITHPYPLNASSLSASQKPKLIGELFKRWMTINPVT